jgi:ribonuclease R
VPRKKDNMDVKVKRADPARSKIPTKEDILQFIRASTANIGRREIARAFDIKGSDRIDLKRMLKELAADGLIADPRRGMRSDRGSRAGPERRSRRLPASLERR